MSDDEQHMIKQSGKSDLTSMCNNPVPPPPARRLSRSAELRIRDQGSKKIKIKILILRDASRHGHTACWKLAATVHHGQALATGGPGASQPKKSIGGYG